MREKDQYKIPIFSYSQGGRGILIDACNNVYILANDLNPLSSPPLIKFPASQFKGESAAGCDNKEIIDLSVLCIV